MRARLAFIAHWALPRSARSSHADGNSGPVGTLSSWKRPSAPVTPRHRSKQIKDKVRARFDNQAMSAPSTLPLAPAPAATKNKTVTAWLAFIGGQLGLHRFYLFGPRDGWAWLHPVAAALGWWGVMRVRTYGQDDQLAWLLVPLFGFTVAAAALTAI